MLARLYCVVLLGLIVIPQTAIAQGFESYSCEDLWLERNTIYKERGYCVKTQRAIRVFGNEGCQYDDAASVPLSHTERQIISEIQAWERRKRCPR
jgi:hypothetical protein